MITDNTFYIFLEIIEKFSNLIKIMKGVNNVNNKRLLENNYNRKNKKTFF